MIKGIIRAQNLRPQHSKPTAPTGLPSTVKEKGSPGSIITKFYQVGKRLLETLGRQVAGHTQRIRNQKGFVLPTDNAESLE